MAKFLDLSGLSHAITKIKEWTNTRLNEEVTIKVVKVNGKPLSPDGSKGVNVDLSTYAIKTEVTQEIAQAVSGIQGFDAQVVEQLPQTGKKGILYLVANSGSGQNVYDEYLWVTDKFEKLGTREIDLTAYAKKTDLPTKTSQLANDSGFLTAVPEEYVTDSELSQKGYETTQSVNNKLEGYVKTADMGTISNEEIDSLFQ
ncbi:hypothetical protein [Faecalimonas umbilicata]|uniref:hypothetical protein n=1 Tax=Faecalimonas umbilicata TaxID=1912855 RepID=UPI002058D924|nr:hypothetical protein [Faecalimonas umbilicata]DAZ45507.1 MAG TPA: hypothetical protein [Caudoviricetes sp.]